MIPPQLIEAAGWTLIHSLWQTAALALAAVVLVKLSGSRSARINYAIYSLALIFAIAWSGYTFVSESSRPIPTAFQDVPTATPSAAQEITLVPSPGLSVPAPTGTERWMRMVVALWIVGVFAMVLRATMASVWIRRLRKTALPWNEPEWQARFAEWTALLGIQRPVRLCTTVLSEVPAAIGHCKPMVLLPASLLTQLTPAQLEAIILHELVHIRRHDYLVNLFQVACETIFFFNPAVWWLSSAIRAEREHCCDDAVAACQGNKIEYAKALVRLEELRLGPANRLSLAATTGSLNTRVARLLGTANPASRFPAATGAVVLALLLFAHAASEWQRAQAETNTAAALELRAVVDEGTPGAKAYPFKRQGIDGREFNEDIFLAQEILLDPSHVANAYVAEDPITDAPQIMVTLTPEGTQRFTEITRAHLGRQVAIVIDGQVQNAPVINEAITGGAFVISGNFNQEKAEALARKLRPATAETISARSFTNAAPSLQEAQQLRRQGKYEEALQRHLWYHTASRQQPGQGGVRLSFALSDWLKLGQAYPPAFQKLKEVRDQTAEAIKQADMSVDPFTLFQEYAGINHVLREEAKTVELFRWLDANKPDIAKQVNLSARKPLLQAGEEQLAAKYIRVQEFEHLQMGLMAEKSRPDTRKQMFRERTLTLVALLVTRGDTAEAESIANRARETLDDPAFHAALQSALQGQVPKQ